MKLYDGMRVRGKIAGEDFGVGIITEEGGRFFICQDVMNGGSCKDKKGKKCSWYIGEVGDFEDGRCDVTDLRPAGFYPVVGDVVIDDGKNRRKVLEVGVNSFLPSASENLESACDWWITFKEAEKLGWKIEGQEEPEEEVLELTLDQIAEKFGVKEVKIKKD